MFDIPSLLAGLAKLVEALCHLSDEVKGLRRDLVEHRQSLTNNTLAVQGLHSKLVNGKDGDNSKWAPPAF